MLPSQGIGAHSGVALPGSVASMAHNRRDATAVVRTARSQGRRPSEDALYLVPWRLGAGCRSRAGDALGPRTAELCRV
jgi:hypothetical protein